MRKTKIICTIGPASEGPDILEELASEGMDIARINMSHGDHEEQARIIRSVRQLQEHKGQEVAILGDLQGPKIRLGEIAESVQLQAGAEFVLTVEPVSGNGMKASVDHPGFCQDVFPGSKVYINDGLIRLEVIEVGEKDVKTKVIAGGELKSHKGVNLPGSKVSVPALTDKDRRDLCFLAAQEVDYVACSFVRTAENIAAVKHNLREMGKQIPLIAKVETREGIVNAGPIFREAHGVMIARGDMGVELPFEEIPLVQKVLVNLGKQMGKPVIVATQMLESMTGNLTPTRAEMTDVANAVIDGAWAVMLSAETASGRHPVEAVKAMRRLIERTESALADGEISFEDINTGANVPDNIKKN